MPKTRNCTVRPREETGTSKEDLVRTAESVRKQAVQGGPPLTANGSIPRAGNVGVMAPPVAPLPGPPAPRKTMLSITDLLCDTAPEKPAPKKPAGSDTYRKSATRRDGVPPLTREELGKLEFQEGTAVRVNTLRFDGPGDVPRLRRGSIAPFAKYPPSLERHYYLPSGKLCHRYMVIMDDTREVMGPFCTALGEILLASGLMSAKLDAA